MLGSINWSYFIVWLAHILGDWAKCVLSLIAVPFLRLQILKLTLAFLSSRFPTKSKSHDKNLNILMTKRAFNIK